jgi:hypothetical protein
MSNKVSNESFENVTNLKYLETTGTHQNYIHEEIKVKVKLSLRLTEHHSMKA